MSDMPVTHAERVLKHIGAQPDRHGWRSDVENAPRDGTLIDLWAYDKKHAEWGRRPDCSWERMANWFGEEFEGWRGLNNTWTREWSNPTHWRLPPPHPEDS